MATCKAAPPEAMTDLPDIGPLGGADIERAAPGTCREDAGHLPLPHNDGAGHFWGEGEA